MEDFIVTANHSEAKRQIALQMRREMTQSERSLWQSLRASRLAGLHFRRQQIIDGFIADFYCHAARLVVELDGGIHESHVEYDAERDQILADRGLFVLRFTNEELNTNRNQVLHKIKTTAYERINTLTDKGYPSA